ncbi:MAG: hypothetical protein KGH60_00535 [Candidatus Micrarchaeota archaeon]|nr:hypothetical protein [Candidatus Micrarchaeota archaeon]
MGTPPKVVLDTFERVKKAYEFSVYLKLINGNYYVYNVTTGWDKINKRVKSKSVYIGRIATDGTYAEKQSANLMSTAKAVVSGRPREMGEQHLNGSIDAEDRLLLTSLSMNARATLSRLEAITGVKRSTIFNRIKNFENKLGFRYLPELNLSKLGYLDYAVFVKFKGEKPRREDLMAVLDPEPSVQLAALAIGEYDLFIYMLAENNREAETHLYTIRTNEKLNKYVSEWYLVPFEKTFGMVPIRDRFFGILEKNVWRKSKGQTRPRPAQLTLNEYTLLKELTRNGAEEFVSIDIKNGFDRGRSQYLYHALKDKKGIIKRITATMSALPIKYNAIIFADVLNAHELLKTRNNLLAEIIGESTYPTNRYSLVGDVTMPNGEMFVLPVFKESDLSLTIEMLKKNVSGINVRSLVLVDVFVGTLCYRIFDTEYTSQHDSLVRAEILPKGEKLRYE